LVERIPQPQLGRYATIEPGQDGYTIGTFGCGGQSKKDLRVEVAENVSVRLCSSVMELVHHNYVVRIGRHRQATVFVQRLDGCEDVATTPWFVHADQELSEIPIAKRRTIFCKALLEDLL